MPEIHQNGYVGSNTIGQNSSLPSRIGIWNVGFFLREGKPEYSEKNLGARE